MLLGVKLSLDVIPGSAHPMIGAIGVLAVRVATLDHESGYDSMKRGPIVKILRREFAKILGVIRRHVRIKFQDDVSPGLPLRRHGNGRTGVCGDLDHLGHTFSFQK